VECEPAAKGSTATAGSVGKATGAEGDFPTARHLKWAAVLLLSYFGLRLVFLATTISPFLPPDERTHYGICSAFADSLLFPRNSPDSYEFGLVTNIPWLYYWILGKLAPLNVFGMNNLLFLRLCNLPLAFGVVFYGWRTLKLVTTDRLSQLLLLVFLTNTMMLTFISAAISYDNLVNLLAAMAIYYLLAFFVERSPTKLALSLLCQLAGCLTKLTFLPLAFIMGVVLLVHELRRLPALPSGLACWFREARNSAVLLTLALALGLGLNLQLYLGNYLSYGKLTLETYDVLPLESALKYRLAARGYILREFQEGHLTKARALEMTTIIDHPGDRADAVYLIENYEKLQGGTKQFMGFAEYVPVWAKRMAAGTFGVFAHLMMPNDWPTIAPIWLVAALAALGVLVRWRPREAQGLPACLAVIAGFYTGVILYRFNYQNYLQTGAPFVALQGRYLFPVLGPIYILASCYLLRLVPQRTGRLALFWLAVLIFLASDFPLFLAKLTPDWTVWPS
jgi:hypothetical protein